MAVFTEPTKWAQTLGKNADVTRIPDTAGGIDPSIDKIFPSVFSIPLAQGGRAIPRSVLNGLFKLLGDWSFYQQNGGIASYSARFDYAVGSFVKYNNQLYICIQVNGSSSTVKAPTNSAYWLPLMYPNNTNNILMAHNAMPSDNFDTLTMGASGTVYTAAADGFFWCAVKVSESGYISGIVRSSSNKIIYSINNVGTEPGQAPYILLPVKKGDNAIINYSSKVTPHGLKFIYAVGSESEQA